ncbi:phosphatidylglycerol lysyltransferase domain-containing protein [Streptomyces sp. RB6PN25]|uniref:Phosphatidylglycerol lysyltransferase domain-containing protein n=1 Tax=Streptomyces humicola TaxID=2953240 RepID=A0ABT1PTL6_9ACTN|nr:phosphatidylglycerol lysyltransferase domain-containing protein [Streptomyces humicola]MCQ4081013.1 phosphatidylglycerol lysyltransferase domain-containing protein [Streptomyces humicola]
MAESSATRPRLPRLQPSNKVPTVVGTLVALIGLLDLATGIIPKLRHSKVHTLAGYLPGTVTSIALAASIIIGILLLMLAHGLKRRKRRAWRTAVVLLPASLVIDALHHRGGIGHVILTVVLLVVLLTHRSEFSALSDPRTRWRALFNFVVLTMVSFGIGLVIVSSHPRDEIGNPGIIARVETVFYGLFGFGGPVHYSSDRVGDIVGYSLGGLGFLILFTTVYLVLRPEHPTAVLNAEDERRIRELLAKHGRRDSLGHFALRRDKSVIFSPTGKAAISYRVISGVMLASGDPIGDVEAWPGAIERFMEEARAHAWIPAVVGCSETGGEVWTRETGLDALELGDEAIVETAGFSLSGRAMRNVRQMVKRVERNGYTCRMRRVSELTDEEKARIRSAAADWRGTDTERGFSMALGRFGDPEDGDCVVVTAHKTEENDPSPHGDLKAVLHFVPWGKDGISLELMRRDRSADAGMNEMLIVHALQNAQELGITRVSLNFAMFRSALARGERIGAGPVLRFWRGLLVFLSRWFQIESLYKFNAKFQPVWEPRFMVFPNNRNLPRIGFAVMQAEAFITLELPARVRRWIPGLSSEPRSHQCAHAEDDGQVAAVGGRAA